MMVYQTITLTIPNFKLIMKLQWSRQCDSRHVRSWNRIECQNKWTPILVVNWFLIRVPRQFNGQWIGQPNVNEWGWNHSSHHTQKLTQNGSQS